MERVKNKVVLITGGTNGMGFASALEFIKEEATSITIGRSQESVDTALASLGANVIGLISNAGNLADIHALPKKVNQLPGKIDVLFVNAGYGKFASIDMADEAHFDELFNMLVKPVYSYQWCMVFQNRFNGLAFYF